MGIVNVPDARLSRLAELFHPDKTTPAYMKFVDIAGLVKGASTGEGLGNQFLANIRDVDAILQVVRLFEDPDVVHTMGTVDPVRDIEVIETELMLADLQSVEKQADRLAGMARSGDKDSKVKLELIEKIRKTLNDGKPARQSGLSFEDMKNFGLLTSKPILYLGNEDEDPAKSAKHSEALKKFAESRNANWLTISGKIESEIAQLSTDEEKKTFREELGLKETGLERLIRESYKLLGLATYFTAGPTEVRGWTIQKGDSAVQAAGKIHSDIAKGFIRADVYKFFDIDKYETEKALQEKGLKRSEGKEYIVQDGDVCYFHFKA